MAEENKKILLEVTIGVKEAVKNLAETKKAIEELRVKQKSLDTTTEDGRKQYEIYGAQIRSLSNDARKYQKEIDNNIKAQKAQEGSTDQLRARVSNLTAEYDALSKQQKKSAEGKELQKTIKGLSDEIKRSNEGIGNFRDSVGEYENKMKSALGINSGFIGTLKNFQSGAKDAGLSMAQYGVQGVKAFGMALKSLLANPIVLILAGVVAAFVTLKNAISSNGEATKKMNLILAPFKVLIEVVSAAIGKMASFLLDGVLAAGKFISSIASLIPGLNKINDAAKEAIELKKEEQKLNGDIREQIVSNAKDELKIAELKNKAKQKDKYTDEERLKFNRQANDIELKMNNEKVSIAQRQFDLFKKQMAERKVTYKDLTKDEKDTYKQMEASIYNTKKEYFQNTMRLASQTATLETEIEKEKEEKAKAAAEKRKEIAQKIAKAELDINNLKSQSLIDKQNEIANNEKLSYAKRLEALSKSEYEQIKIIIRNRDAELKQEGLTAKEKQAIRAKADSEIIKLKASTEKTITDIETKELDKRLKTEAENLYSKKQQLSNDQQDELVKLSQKFAKGKLSATAYEKEKSDIIQKYRESDFNASVDSFTSQLALQNLSADQRKEIERQIAETKNKYAQESAQIAIQANEKIVENEKEAAEKRKEIEQQLTDKKKELFSQLQSTIQDITNGVFERKNIELDEETAKIAEKYDSEIEAAGKNEKQAKALEAEKQKRLEEQDKKKRKLIREQAIIERAFQSFSIIADTAKTVGAIQLNASVLASNPITLPAVPLALAQIPVAIGVGALQLASVMAAPLPKAQRGKVFRGKSHAQGGIPVEVEGDEMILTKGVYRNPVLREIASMINQAGGGISLASGTTNTYMATGGVLSNAMFQDGGYAARNYTDGSLTAKELKQAMKEALAEMKPQRISIEDIRKADENYTKIEDRSNF